MPKKTKNTHAVTDCKSNPRVVVRISKVVDDKIRAYAERNGVSFGEAADALIVGGLDKTKRPDVEISAESLSTIGAYAERKGLTLSEAADACIAYARKRQTALAKYDAKKKAAQR